MKHPEAESDKQGELAAEKTEDRCSRADAGKQASGPGGKAVAALRAIFSRIWSDTFLFTIIAIVIGFVIGALILLMTGFNPMQAYRLLFEGIFGTPKSRMYSFQFATPIIFTGLSVTFAFKTGLFNIGAEGQYIMGSLVAMVLGVSLKLPPVVHGVVCVLGGGLAGAVWGGIAGLLKAYRGISEVIVTIMLNWTAFSFANFIIMSPAYKKPSSTASVTIAETAKISTNALSERYGNVSIHWGMLLAIAAVIIIWIILNKTTLGFRLRMVGFNRDAAEYAGVGVPASITTSMAVSGLLAGLGGATQLCGVLGNLTQLANQEGYGFDGISVSMIGGINPIGAFFSGFFFGGMKYGGAKLNMIQAPTELVNVIIGVIIYTIAIMSAFRLIISFIKSKRGGRPV